MLSIKIDFIFTLSACVDYVNEAFSPVIAILFELNCYFYWGQYEIDECHTEKDGWRVAKLLIPTSNLNITYTTIPQSKM